MPNTGIPKTTINCSTISGILCTPYIIVLLLKDYIFPIHIGQLSPVVTAEEPPIKVGYLLLMVFFGRTLWAVILHSLFCSFLWRNITALQSWWGKVSRKERRTLIQWLTWLILQCKKHSVVFSATGRHPTNSVFVGWWEIWTITLGSLLMGWNNPHWGHNTHLPQPQPQPHLVEWLLSTATPTWLLLYFWWQPSQLIVTDCTKTRRGKKKIMGHMACDTWHVTHDMWQVGGGQPSLKISAS